MTDINIAKTHLQNNNLSMVIVRDGNILEESSAKGIKPIFEVYTKRKDNLKDSFVADRVIGKAAAMILANGGIKALYTDIISSKAIEILDKYNIVYEYAKKVPIILNRDGSDMCPIEKLSSNTDDVEKLISDIEVFINNILK